MDLLRLTPQTKVITAKNAKNAKMERIFSAFFAFFAVKNPHRLRRSRAAST